MWNVFLGLTFQLSVLTSTLLVWGIWKEGEWALRLWEVSKGIFQLDSERQAFAKEKSREEVALMPGEMLAGGGSALPAGAALIGVTLEGHSVSSLSLPPSPVWPAASSLSGRTLRLLGSLFLEVGTLWDGWKLVACRKSWASGWEECPPP